MRTSFLVDGFNLYHSLTDASRALGGAGTRWLDLFDFCESSLYLLGGHARMEGVHYFSALARHLEVMKPEVTSRHLAYIECLRATGVRVELSQFKRKRIRCPHCSQAVTRYEEKETDVAIAARLLELCSTDQCDAVALLTGDSDLVPALRVARRLFPRVELYSIFPFGRVSIELRPMVDRSFKTSSDRYLKHQLPDPFVLEDGRQLHKPSAW